MRADLDKALRDAQRELAEGEYDECMEAVEYAQTALGPGGAVAASLRRAERPLEEDERVSVDQDFPVSTEGAGVPDRGEVEVRVLAGYSRLRSLRSLSSGGDDDDDGPRRRHGRDLTAPSIEAEVGLGHGLSASLGLPMASAMPKRPRPARQSGPQMELPASPEPPPGTDADRRYLGPLWPAEAALGLLASQPLSRGRMRQSCTRTSSGSTR